MPVHDSWLNQIEVDFSSQRKLLNPKDFSTLAALKSDLIRFPTTLRKIAVLDHFPRRRERNRGALLGRCLPLQSVTPRFQPLVHNQSSATDHLSLQ
jgi:hypothetical protein